MPRSFVQYLIISLALCLATLSTALASPLYAIYEQLWGITTAQVGYVFIAYMFGVVFSLIFLNKLHALYSYKKIIVFSLCFSIIGLILSALASSIWHLGLSRFIIGISSGLITTAAMVGLRDHYPFNNQLLCEKITSMITVLGFALGPLLGGFLADHTPRPLADPYWIIIGFAAFILLSVSFVKPRFTLQSHYKLSALLKFEGLVLPQTESRKIFWICSISALCSFAAFGLYAALAGTFLQDLPLQSSATMTGLSISIILFVSVLSQLLSQSLKEIIVLYTGLISLLLGIVSLVIAEIGHQIIFLGISILLTGIGHGFSLSTSYYLIGKIIDQEKNPLIFSSFLLIAYQGTIWPIIFSGYLIEIIGLITTLMILSVILFSTIIWLIYQIKYRAIGFLSTSSH